MYAATTQTTLSWRLVYDSYGIEIELDACYPQHLTYRGWQCVVPASSTHREHTKDLMQAGHNAIHRGKVGRSGSVVCLDAGLSQGAQASLGDDNIS